MDDRGNFEADGPALKEHYFEATDGIVETKQGALLRTGRL